MSRHFGKGTDMAVKAYLEAIMTIEPENRAAAAEVYTTYRQPFLDDIEGALTKELLVRDCLLYTSDAADE